MKRISKRMTKSICLYGLTLGLLASASSAAIAQDLKGDIEYGYWGNAARAEVTEKVSRLFEQKHPGTKITGVSAEYNAYIERLTVQSAASELACVTQVQSTFLASYANRGALLPLDELVQSGAIDLKGIPPEILETGKFDGKQYMVPTGTFVRLLAYNKTMASEYAIDPPVGHANFADYETWLRAAQKKLPKGVYATENEAPIPFSLYSWVAGHGETMFKDGQLSASPEVIAAWFRFWNDLAKDGVAIPPDRLDEQLANLELTPFANGKTLVATRDIPHISIMERVRASQGVPTEIEFVSNPAKDATASGNVPGTNGLTISANCDNAPLAAAYINFFGNDPAAAIAYQSSNGVVVSKTGREALLDDPNTSTNVKRSLAELDKVTSASDIATANYPSGYQGMAAVLRRQYEEVAFNGTSPEDAAQAFIDEVNSLLN
ncbi:MULTISPECIES: extracellular solute-binding protein [Rhizobium/Agrobacterium group]|uniref:ABC transporter substrate-binding protein n=1 Tax=Rhizobium/Agrobacterium group TaxID=227290 RepID=UPI001ADBE5F7|nr:MULTISPECIES: extracellular solute-binding protein [Rhizobium/Agrobacterium group]MBO9112625.1 extracellular solute-binding protein [Agrobacterium sp. S2/73]QXZ76125.1 extracellular solute-binding protein [Agrobacterium sp. S7/73]QYA16871.1 extracellular solute-binding protein [Rhizobium sp. AB2/73]UEQ85557.1 extracellular solute-binding protein [Rhizobium sp. AB2/73]